MNQKEWTDSQVMELDHANTEEVPTRPLISLIKQEQPVATMIVLTIIKITMLKNYCLPQELWYALTQKYTLKPSKKITDFSRNHPQH